MPSGSNKAPQKKCPGRQHKSYVYVQGTKEHLRSAFGAAYLIRNRDIITLL